MRNTIEIYFELPETALRGIDYIERVPIDAKRSVLIGRGRFLARVGFI